MEKTLNLGRLIIRVIIQRKKNKPSDWTSNAQEACMVVMKIITKTCRIYTRKSTDKRLDMEFNTLDAQRESYH